MTLYLAAKPSANGVFNIGSGQAHSWNEMARALFSALGLPPRIEYIEMPASIRDQYQYFTQADIGKLFAAGYDRPVTSLDDAVRDYVVYHLLPGKSLGKFRCSRANAPRWPPAPYRDIRRSRCARIPASWQTPAHYDFVAVFERTARLAVGQIDRRYPA